MFIHQRKQCWSIVSLLYAIYNISSKDSRTRKMCRGRTKAMLFRPRTRTVRIKMVQFFASKCSFETKQHVNSENCIGSSYGWRSSIPNLIQITLSNSKCLSRKTPHQWVWHHGSTNLQLADVLADICLTLKASAVELVNLLKISLALLPSNDPHSPWVMVLGEM